MQPLPDAAIEEKQVDKKEKRKARRDLLALLKYLRNLCDKFQTVEEWLDFVDKKVTPLLNEHQRSLGPENIHRLNNATRLTESTREGVRMACRTLRFEIAKIFPVPIPVPIQIAAGVLIGAAVLVGAGVIALNLMAVNLEIINHGCVFNIPAYYNNIPGFTFPDEMPSDGTPFQIRINSFIELDTSQPDGLILRFFGRDETVPLGSLRSIVLDGQRELLGQVNPQRLDAGSRHVLELLCE
jgi:hypothetical protein